MSWRPSTFAFLVSVCACSAVRGRKRMIRKAANTTTAWARRAPKAIEFCRLYGFGLRFRNGWLPHAEVNAKILSETWIDKMRSGSSTSTRVPRTPPTCSRKRFYVLCGTLRICGDNGNGIGVHSGSWLACSKFVASVCIMLRIHLYEGTPFFRFGQ